MVRTMLAKRITLKLGSIDITVGLWILLKLADLGSYCGLEKNLHEQRQCA